MKVSTQVANAITATVTDANVMKDLPTITKMSEAAFIWGDGPLTVRRSHQQHSAFEQDSAWAFLATQDFTATYIVTVCMGTTHRRGQ